MDGIVSRVRRLPLLAALLVGGLPVLLPHPAPAVTWPPAVPSSAKPAERCRELLAYFDYYGAHRGEHSDGMRNHTRIAAEIDCNRGDYLAGIAAMEALLKRKKFDVPAFVPPVPPANAPAPPR